MITLAKQFVLNRVAPSWWWGQAHEPFTGAWQRNIICDDKESLLRNAAVYGCVTGIAGDVAKMRIKLTRQNGSGIWTEIMAGSPWLPVLRTPNHYQTRIAFVTAWVISKLTAGNTYVLKERDQRGIVNALYVLDPRRVMPLVAENGNVYYQLHADHLSHLEETVTVPASEIIHDLMPALWHPLVGVSPLWVIALAGTLGNRILLQSAGFFANQALPGGILTAPGKISAETADRLKKDFEENFSGSKKGRLAVLGDGLTFSAMQMTAEAAQLAEQLKLTREEIATAFHYPLFKLGGPLPPYAGNVEALTTSYYTDCLQILIESIELLLDEGLSLPNDQGVRFDLDALMRMDTASLYKTNSEGVGGGWLSPDEARYKANLPAVEGGDSPYLQQQNYSLSALAKRDSQQDPFNPPEPEPPQLPEGEAVERSYIFEHFTQRRRLRLNE